jgi:hypothetical protein
MLHYVYSVCHREIERNLSVPVSSRGYRLFRSYVSFCQEDGERHDKKFSSWSVNVL